MSTPCLWNNPANLKPVMPSDAPLLDRFFQLAGYRDCNYNVVNVFLWQNIDPLYFLVDSSGRYLLLFIMTEHEFYAFAPLCTPEYLKEALQELDRVFQLNQMPFIIPWCPANVQTELEELFPKRFSFEINPNETEYIYQAEKLRTYSGKQMQKKRNHVNFFLKTYEGRFEFREMNTIGCRDCLELVERWMMNREPSRALEAEHKGILDLFALNQFMEFRIGGVFVDGVLEGFSICSWLISHQVVQVHVEKANADIRGLYPYLVMKMQAEFYPTASLVNREDDVGVEALRRSKQSYHPDEYWEKAYCKEQLNKVIRPCDAASKA